MITVNFEKAKEITKNRLRFERIPLLESQDILYMKAMEKKQDVSLIIAEKQRLRDLTNLVDNCETLDDLKNLSA